MTGDSIPQSPGTGSVNRFLNVSLDSLLVFISGLDFQHHGVRLVVQIPPPRNTFQNPHGKKFKN
jgi:hypothetical protein